MTSFGKHERAHAVALREVARQSAGGRRQRRIAERVAAQHENRAAVQRARARAIAGARPKRRDDIADIDQTNRKDDTSC